MHPTLRVVATGLVWTLGADACNSKERPIVLELTIDLQIWLVDTVDLIATSSVMIVSA